MSSDEGLLLATNLIHDDVMHHRAIPISPALVDILVGAELCPLGIAHQSTINERGEIIEKQRACHDHSYHGAPSGQSLNIRTDKVFPRPL